MARASPPNWPRVEPSLTSLGVTLRLSTHVPKKSKTKDCKLNCSREDFRKGRHLKS